MMETNKSIRRHHEMHIYFELTSLTIGLIRIRHLECFHLTGLRRETYVFKKEKKKGFTCKYGSSNRCFTKYKKNCEFRDDKEDYIQASQSRGQSEWNLPSNVVVAKITVQL